VTLVYQHELPNVPGKSIKGVLVEYGAPSRRAWSSRRGSRSLRTRRTARPRPAKGRP
jgi:hypothetical protein